METRSQSKTRLQAEGRWEEFVSRRESLKSQGMSATKAHAAAILEYPPLDRSAPAGAANLADEDLMVRLAADGSGRRPELREVVEWVFEHALIPWSDVRDPPSAGAVGLLRFAKRNDFCYQQFLALWGKLIPAKGASENDGIRDDGRKLFPLFAAFDQQFAAGAQETSGEPGVPPGDSEASGD